HVADTLGDPAGGCSARAHCEAGALAALHEPVRCADPVGFARGTARRPRSAAETRRYGMRGGGGELERRHEDALVVPIFLPDLVRPLLPWTRRHVHQIARRYAVSLADCWDEAKTALRRAAVYYDAGRQNAQRPFASRPADLPVLSERHPPLRADGG